MLLFLKRLFPASVIVLLTAVSAMGRCNSPKPLDRAEFEALYTNPLNPPGEALSVFHIGHSLVGRDMPAMLAQLSGRDHRYESQLGWGTTLKAHWEPDEVINGFEVENNHARYRDATEAMASGEYNTLVLTEMVEIRDAIKYFQSADYLRRWAGAGWAGNPDMRVYLYETWHDLDDPEGWLSRLDQDLDRYWECEILRQALAYDGVEHPIYVIPAGQVMAAVVRRIEAQGGIGPVSGRDELFALKEDGSRDQIHVNDLGAYLVALVHYAVLYQRSPVGLPYTLKRANGSRAYNPGPELAMVMQEVTWEVVRSYSRSGVQQD